MSQITKKYKVLSFVFLVLSISVTVFPIAYYVIKAFVEGSTTDKLSMGLFATLAIVLCVVNLMFKLHLRSTIWLLVLGIYIAIEAIMPLMIMVAAGTITDELILTPLYKHFKSKASINYEIDKRIP